MADLWEADRRRKRARAAPLALRMRPRSLDEFVGQEPLLGPGRLLRRLIETDRLTSLILHGPPGVGKTALAEVIASATNRAFVRENAASVGVARIRSVIEEADRRLVEQERGTILFLDEIHRFSKAQQDALLGDVERGLLTLIGATTENPLFTVNSALVSRSALFRLEPLGEEHILTILRRALADEERGLGAQRLQADDEALVHIAAVCDGDARRALNALEIAACLAETSAREEERRITLELAREATQSKAIRYGRQGDEHYDAASAMIKALRGCDPDAALHWMAVMLEGGEDPRFIARRLAILASEDVGNADPQAMVVAAACFALVERVGMPEARIILAQCATYLALAPKSNASYKAIEAALAQVRSGRSLPVPEPLRDANAASGRRLTDKARAQQEALARRTGEAVDESLGAPQRPDRYIYPHDQPANTSMGAVTGQDLLGRALRYYHPTDRGFEQVLRTRLREALAVRGLDDAEQPLQREGQA